MPSTVLRIDSYQNTSMNTGSCKPRRCRIITWAVLEHKTKSKIPITVLGLQHRSEYPTDDILQELMLNGIVGVASGRAEFARALQSFFVCRPQRRVYEIQSQCDKTKTRV